MIAAAFGRIAAATRIVPPYGREIAFPV